jgi:hypothetical protein
MSKEQINYLLVLLTVFIFWLFFNTFYTGAKMNPRPGNFGGGRAPVFAVQPPKMPAALDVSSVRPPARPRHSPSVQAPSAPAVVAEMEKAVQEKK